MKKISFLLISLLFVIGTILSCRKGKEEHSPSTGGNTNVTIKFANYINGSPLQTYSMIYVDSAGNPYEVDGISYFISDVQFHKSGGTIINIDSCEWAHLVCDTIPSSLTWNICDKVPAGTYDSISFRFGIISSKNISFMFVNPPESYMEWGGYGGGYHYMMLNGKWKDSINHIEIFNTHLGIGRVIFGSDTIYVDNSFHVKLPNSAFTISKGESKEIQIIMNIDRWYKNPYIFDFNYYGGMIMMNQDAMHKIASNGWDVFTVGYIH